MAWRNSGYTAFQFNTDKTKPLAVMNGSFISTKGYLVLKIILDMTFQGFFWQCYVLQLLFLVTYIAIHISLVVVAII